jgi:hypothetical protein
MSLNERRRRTVNSLYPVVNPLRQCCFEPSHLPHSTCPTPLLQEDRTRWPCFRPTQRRRSPPGLLPKDWSNRSRRRCRSPPACGARSSRRGRSATSSRDRSSLRAIGLPDGSTKLARTRRLRPPKLLSSSSLCLRGEQPIVQAARRCAGISRPLFRSPFESLALGQCATATPIDLGGAATNGRHRCGCLRSAIFAVLVQAMHLEHVLGQIGADCRNLQDGRSLRFEWLLTLPLWHVDGVIG